MQAISYKEWRKTVKVEVSDKLVEEMRQYHNVDAHAEIELALQKEYKFYIEQTYE